MEDERALKVRVLKRVPHLERNHSSPTFKTPRLTWISAKTGVAGQTWRRGHVLTPSFSSFKETHTHTHVCTVYRYQPDLCQASLITIYAHTPTYQIPSPFYYKPQIKPRVPKTLKLSFFFSLLQVFKPLTFRIWLFSALVVNIMHMVSGQLVRNQIPLQCQLDPPADLSNPLTILFHLTLNFAAFIRL